MTLDYGLNLAVVSTAAAAGSTNRATTALDMANYEGVIWHAAFGVISVTAVTAIKAQQCSASGGTFNDLLGSYVAITTGQTGKSVALGIYRPLKRWVRCMVVRGTANAVVNSVLAIRYGARQYTTDVLDSTGTVVAHEVHVSPSTGTAS